jgi:hypothetical protein
MIAVVSYNGSVLCVEIILLSGSGIFFAVFLLVVFIASVRY